MESHSNTNLSLSYSTQYKNIPYNSTFNGFKFLATLKAPTFVADKRSPLDLICVVDRSGSMAGEKLRLVKETLKYVVSQLTPTDRLGIVTYDDTVGVALHLQEMNSAGKDFAESAISSIYEGGSTNLCGGLVEGISLMRQRTTKNEVSSVLVFTDGLANVGYSSLPDITRAMTDPDFAAASGRHFGGYNAIPQMQRQVPMPSPRRNQTQVQTQAYIQQPQLQQQQAPVISPYPPVYGNANNLSPLAVGPSAELVGPSTDLPRKHVPLGCTVYTFGFGSDHDPNLLKGIAEAGNGVYYFIEGPTKIPESFADCLGGLLSVAAQNITLTFEALNSVKISRVMTKFTQKVLEEGKTIEVNIGDIQSDEQRDIIVEIAVPSSANPSEQFSICRVAVQYQNVIDKSTEKTAVMVTVNRPTTAEREEPNFQLDKQSNRFIAAEAMERATDLANSGKLPEAKQLLEKVIAQISESVSSSDPFCQGLVVDLKKCAETLRDTTSYQQMGQHLMYNNINAHYMQRSANPSMASQMAYATPSRAMQQKVQSANINY